MDDRHVYVTLLLTAVCQAFGGRKTHQRVFTGGGGGGGSSDGLLGGGAFLLNGPRGVSVMMRSPQITS